MAYYNGRSYTNLRGLNLSSQNGVLRFETPDVTPTTTSNERLLYVNSSDQLIFDDGSSTTTLGSAGAVSNFSLNDAYDDGSTITVDSSTIQLNASIAGAALTISQSGAGADITGTSSSWTVTKAGAATFTGVVLGDDENITFGASSDATIDWEGSNNVLNIAGAVDFDDNVTLAANATITQTGVAGSDVYTVTAGDVVLSDGSLSITDADVAATLSVTSTAALLDATTGGVVTVVADSVTTGRVIDVNADGVTSGTLLHLDTSASGFSGNYIQCYDGAADDFTVGANGAVTVAGNGGSDVLTITAGDAVMSDGSLTLTDADNAVSLSVTNNTATTSDVVQLTGSGTFTGTGASAFVAVTQSGATTGDVVSITADALTSGTALLLDSSGTMTGNGALLEGVADSATTAAGIYRLSADGLTTGNAVAVASTSTSLTTGNLLDLDYVASGSSLSNKTAELVDVNSSRTETRTSGTTADDYDVASLVRTNVMNGAGGTLTAAGSILYIENVATQTAGTLTDTVNGIEIVLDVDGDGDGIDITTNSTAGRALDVNTSVTSVPAVDIDGDGVIANNVGLLDVAGSGATASGGAMLRVSQTGTPAAADSYLVDFDYSGATFTNNPDAVHIATDGTGRALHISNAGLSAVGSPTVDIESTNAGAVGAVLRLFHQGGSQAASDVVGAITFTGEDDGAADNEYGRIEATVVAATAGSESGSLDFYAGDADGGVTQALQLTHDGSNGFVTAGDGAATAIVESNGNFDLQLQTGNSTTGTITLTDGANGDFTFAPNGTGGLVVTPSSGAALTAALTVTVGDFVMSDGVIQLGTDAGITADVGSAQGNGAITNTVNEVSTVGTSGDALTLPTAVAGRMVYVINHGANAADLFPASGDAINEGSADAAVSVAANETVLCIAYDATNWEVLTMART